eukprot:scaffold292700_cov30-Tisochrysis_lutea.AAC.5
MYQACHPESRPVCPNRRLRVGKASARSPAGYPISRPSLSRPCESAAYAKASNCDCAPRPTDDPTDARSMRRTGCRSRADRGLPMWAGVPCSREVISSVASAWAESPNLKRREASRGIPLVERSRKGVGMGSMDSCSRPDGSRLALPDSSRQFVDVSASRSKSLCANGGSISAGLRSGVSAGDPTGDCEGAVPPAFPLTCLWDAGCKTCKRVPAARRRRREPPVDGSTAGARGAERIERRTRGVHRGPTSIANKGVSRGGGKLEADASQRPAVARTAAEGCCKVSSASKRPTPAGPPPPSPALMAQSPGRRVDLAFTMPLEVSQEVAAGSCNSSPPATSA